MSELVQLVYASRATFAANGDGTLVEPEVARILTQSRRNNRPKDIGGVLCFADGCFFQCLEGDPSVVEPLYQRLHADPRHADVQLLLKRSVTRRQFKLWAMKYITVDDAVKKVLKSAALDRFDPYRFDEPTINRMLHTLREATHQPPVQGDREPVKTVRRERLLHWPSFGIGVASATIVAAGLYLSGLMPG
ncbi:MAG: BLUF domain-containing protein [Wenzhouxiangella sp.]